VDYVLAMDVVKCFHQLANVKLCVHGAHRLPEQGDR
jgi:hypothetical protein